MENLAPFLETLVYVKVVSPVPETLARVPVEVGSPVPTHVKIFCG